MKHKNRKLTLEERYKVAHALYLKLDYMAGKQLIKCMMLREKIDAKKAVR